MQNFTDIHSHIAWGIDDGVPDQKTAEACLQQAYEDGIRNILFTPHIVPGHQSDSELQAIDARICDAIKLAEKYHIHGYSGGEVFINSSYDIMFERNWNRTINGTSNILVEFDTRMQLPEESQIEDRLYEIQINGCTPVIAHAERYFSKGVDLRRVEGWINSGCLIQINRSSLVGGHGKTNEKNAWAIIENGTAHAIASDVHRSHGNRIIKLSDAYECIKKRCGERAAEQLCCENPLKIIKGEAVTAVPIQKQTLLKRFFGGK